MCTRVKGWVLRAMCVKGWMLCTMCTAEQEWGLRAMRTSTHTARSIKATSPPPAAAAPRPLAAHTNVSTPEDDSSTCARGVNVWMK